MFVCMGMSDSTGIVIGLHLWVCMSEVCAVELSLTFLDSEQLNRTIRWLTNVHVTDSETTLINVYC